MQAWLEVKNEAQRGRMILLPATEFQIGRDAICQLRPKNNTVSGRHCKLWMRGEAVWVRDLGSEAGTLLNGQCLHGQARLNDGDRLQVGPLLFQVHLERRQPSFPTGDYDLVAALLRDQPSATAPHVPYRPESASRPVRPTAEIARDILQQYLRRSDARKPKCSPVAVSA